MVGPTELAFGEMASAPVAAVGAMLVPEIPKLMLGVAPAAYI